MSFEGGAFLMRFTDGFLEELRAKNDIETVVSSYVQLKPSGRLLSGLCPFHGEKTPSFYGKEVLLFMGNHFISCLWALTIRDGNPSLLAECRISFWKKGTFCTFLNTPIPIRRSQCGSEEQFL